MNPPTESSHRLDCYVHGRLVAVITTDYGNYAAPLMPGQLVSRAQPGKAGAR